MKIWERKTGSTIELGIGDPPPRVEPSSVANQSAPTGWYVYGHRREDGTLFYIGKGTGRRAWSDARHYLWTRYVNLKLDGKYSVVILADDLTEHEAVDLESQWLGQEADTLVNWQNLARAVDLDAVDRRNALARENRELCQSAREIEESDPEDAIAKYYQALARLDSYATIQSELGLVGQLLHESTLEFGKNGDIGLLDRITLCLVRAGRAREAAAVADQYFVKYRADRESRKAEPIRKRLAKRTSG